MTELADAVAQAVLAQAGVAADAFGLEVGGSSGLDADAHLAVIAASAEAEDQAARMLHRAVVAARGAGVSWARIGERLGMSRQAAQQRFGGQVGAAGGDDERWLGPVTAFDEMAELELAGREGWHTVEAGMLAHRMLRTDTQWEHRRTLWRGPSAKDAADGWQIGCRAFPWMYLVRDTGIPAVRPAESSGSAG